MDQRLIDLYDQYTHAPLPRRVFLERLSSLAGGAAAAAALLPLLEGRPGAAAIVAEDDARLTITRITFPGATGEVGGYLAMSKEAGRRPAVVVIHENRGLNPHIEDVARRLALEGFAALAPDALSPLGGTPDDPDQARDMIRRLDSGRTLRDYIAAVEYMEGHGAANGRVGCVGFCWGGGMANALAVNSRALDAAVVYYGASPEPEDVAKIGAPLLLHFAGLDRRINAGVPSYEAALKEHGKNYTLHMYEGVNHAFNNDTREARYDNAAAQLAWGRTIAFLEEHLSG